MLKLTSLKNSKHQGLVARNMFCVDGVNVPPCLEKRSLANLHCCKLCNQRHGNDLFLYLACEVDNAAFHNVGWYIQTTYIACRALSLKLLILAYFKR